MRKKRTAKIKALAGNCGSSRQAEQTGCDPDGGTCNELCTGSENGIRNGSEAGALRTGRGDGTDETADRKCKSRVSGSLFSSVRKAALIRRRSGPATEAGIQPITLGKTDPSYRDSRIYDYRMADVSVGKLDGWAAQSHLPLAYFNHKKNIVTIQSKRKVLKESIRRIGL